MPARYLITTADQRSWVKDRPVLFLGGWCKRYSKRNDWELLDSETVPYHWDDRQQLYKDYCYLTSFYEHTLIELAAALNTLHGVKHSTRYWRIVVGPWLGYFIQMVFDRWQMIHRAIQQYEISGTSFLEIDENMFVPHHMEHFSQLLQNNLWNHIIFKLIIKKETNIPCNYICIPESKPDKYNSGLNDHKKIRDTVLSILGLASSALSAKNNYFFIDSYLGKAQWLLEAELGQFPRRMHSPSLQKNPISRNMRSDLPLSSDVKKNKFEKFVYSIIPQHIPTSCLEGYAGLVAKTEKISWPTEPKIIFTGNGHVANDFFKTWAAKKVENGSKLIIGQYGGHYGTGKWSFLEDHELDIADQYFSWGWTKPDSLKINPMPSIMLSRTAKMTPNSKGGILLASVAAPQLSYWVYSLPVASQFENYFKEQLTFAETLAPEASRNLVIRLYPHDNQWDQKNRWQERIPDIHFDDLKRSFKMSLQKNRLFIGTYNATTFLQTFSANFPTILFWNPAHWELNDTAQPFYDKLHQAGILHYTPESAAVRVNEIYPDPLSWWNRAEIQTVKNNFCNKFALISRNQQAEWVSKLKLLAGQSQKI